jgi:acetyl-CoA acetyltransferase
MSPREVVIVGVADAPLADGRVASGSTVLNLQADAAIRALHEADLSMDDVDGLLTAAGWGVPGPGSMATTTLAEYFGIVPRFLDSTSIGGSSFEAHVAHAALAIAHGYCEVALVTYASMQRSLRSRTLGGAPAQLNAQFEGPWGLLTPAGSYALAATRYLYQYAATREQLASVAVAARTWAALNPAATRREPLTVDDVLASPLISDPLRVLDCCLVTDGAGAVVLTSAEHARAQHVQRPVYVRGFAEATTHNYISQMPDLLVTPAAQSGPRAMTMAGITPDQVDVLGVYDSFTITVLLTLEALGFCKPGEAGAFVAAGHTSPGGSLPMNTSGGGLSYCHPGMYGIFLIIEAVRQLRGECGERQVKDARTALINGTGGTLSSTATCVLSLN